MRDRWRFVGFLPRKKGELRALVSTMAETLVAFESPRRVAAALATLAEVDPERPVAVCRELTKVHEEVVRGTAQELAARYASEPPRGEVALVLAIGAYEQGMRDYVYPFMRMTMEHDRQFGGGALEGR